MAETVVLSEFEGKPVTEVGVEIPGAAGGLRDAMKFDPVEWHQDGDEHYIVLKCTVEKVRHEAVEKADPTGNQRRVHVMRVEQAAPMGAKLVQREFTAYQERIQKAKDEAEGVLSLNLNGEGGEDEDNLPIGDQEAAE